MKKEKIARPKVGDENEWRRYLWSLMKHVDLSLPQLEKLVEFLKVRKKNETRKISVVIWPMMDKPELQYAAGGEVIGRLQLFDDNWIVDL